MLFSNFALIKNSLAATISLAIINEPDLPLLVLIAFLSIASVYWLVSHREILQKKYALAEADAAIPGPYDKAIYGYKPKLRELAPVLATIGLVALWFAYMAAHGDPPYRVAKLIHQYFGVSGVVVFWSVLGVFMLAKGIETIIGSRTSDKT